MPVEVWVPRLGLVTFSDHMTREEQEAAMYRLCMTPQDERGALVRPFSFEDDTGACVEGLEYLDAPLTGVDGGRLMAFAVRALESAVQLRVKWFTQAEAFVVVPNTPTTCGACLGCGDPLPSGDLLGRCMACKRAMRHLVFGENDIPIAHGIN